MKIKPERSLKSIAPILLKLIKDCELISKCYNEILETIDTFSDTQLREKVKIIFLEPVPTFIKSIYTDQNKIYKIEKNLYSNNFINQEGVLKKIFKKAENNVNIKNIIKLSPGASNGSHSSYPGGLIFHTLMNINIAKSLINSYEKQYDFKINRDNILASMVLHDLMKSWILEWDKNLIVKKENIIANTKSHHIMILAEILFSDFSVEIARLIASIHSNPIKKNVVNYIKAAGIISEVDIIKKQVFLKDNNLNSGLGWKLKIDHWIAYSTESSFREYCIWCSSVINKELDHYLSNKNICLTKIQKQVIKYYILANQSDIRLYEILLKKGKDELYLIIDSLIKNIIKDVL